MNALHAQLAAATATTCGQASRFDTAYVPNDVFMSAHALELAGWQLDGIIISLPI